LLRELEPGAGGEDDVVIGGEQGDQGDHDAGEHLETALEIKTAATDAERAKGGATEETAWARCDRRSRWCCQVWRRFRRRLALHQSLGASTLQV
jgi:hypothetical protein